MRRRVALMLAVALLAAACGGGSDGGDAETAEPSADESSAGADEGSGAVLSSDGLLTVTPPEGAPAISVEVADAPEIDVDGAQVAGSYVLEPSGTQFEEPVVVEFALPPGAIESGVFAVLDSADGSLESVEFTVESGDVLRAEIDHFSVFTVVFGRRVELVFEVPSQLAVGASFEATWDVFDVDGDSNTDRVLATSSTEVTVASPVMVEPVSVPAGEPASVRVTCTDVGPGSVSWTGLLRIDHDTEWAFFADGPTRVFRSAEFHRIDDITAIECIDAATPVEFADERCVDWNTSEERDDCPLPRVEMTFADLTVDAHVTPPPEAFTNPDDSLAASFWAFDGDVTVAVECRWPDGWCNFFNQFFLPASTESGATIALDDAGGIDITGLPFTVRDGMVWIDWPDLEFLGGNGEVLDQLPAGSAPIVDANTFTRVGDRFHTGNMDLDAVAALIGEG